MVDEDFESKLKQGAQRFIAHAIEHGLEHGRRTHEDFLRHFPPHAIMSALEEHPKLRANILVITTGLRSRIAIKKTPADSAVDLDIALAEDETDAETIVTLFDADDRVRYLAASDLWSYVVEGDFWSTDSSDDTAFGIARDHIQFLLERALADGVISARDVVEGAGVEQLATHLPTADVAKLLAAALGAGREGGAFTDDQVLAEVPCATLVRHVPLPTLWRGVIEGRVAPALGVGHAPKIAIAPPPATQSEPAGPAQSDVVPAGKDVKVAKPALPTPKNAIGRMPLVKKPARRSRRPGVAKETKATPAPRRSRRPKAAKEAPKPRRSKRPAAKAS